MNLSVSGLRFDRRVIVSNILTLFSGSLVSQGMTSVALLITARQLEASVYGQYASAFVLAGFTSIVFNLGIDIWLLREGGRRPDTLSELLGSTLAIKAGLGLIWFVLLSSVAPYLNRLLDSASFSPQLIRLSALSIWLDGALATLLTGYKARLRNRMTSVLQIGSGGLWLLGTLLLIGLGSSRAAHYMGARVLVSSAVLLVTLLLVGLEIGFKITSSMIARIARAVFPFAASEFLAWTSMRVDVLIIALTLGEREVGLYSPSVGLISAAFLIPATVYAVSTPVLSNLFMTNTRQAWLSARRMLLVLVLLGAVMAVTVLAGAGLVTQLLGPSFSGSREVLRRLAPIPFIHSLTFGMAAILVATNRQGHRVLVQVVAVSINATINSFIVRIAGIRGVALVYVFTEMVLLSGYAWIVFKQYRRSVSDSTSAFQLGRQ